MHDAVCEIFELLSCFGGAETFGVSLQLRKLGFERAVFLDGGGEGYAQACPLPAR